MRGCLSVLYIFFSKSKKMENGLKVQLMFSLQLHRMCTSLALLGKGSSPPGYFTAARHTMLACGLFLLSGRLFMLLSWELGSEVSLPADGQKKGFRLHKNETGLLSLPIIGCSTAV